MYTFKCADLRPVLSFEDKPGCTLRAQIKEEIEENIFQHLSEVHHAHRGEVKGLEDAVKKAIKEDPVCERAAYSRLVVPWRNRIVGVGG